MDGTRELYADFQQYYGLDLDRLMDGGEYGRINTLTLMLPEQSRTVRKIDPRAEWDEHAYLLALIADNIGFQRWEQGGGKGRKPKPVQRPKPKAAKAAKHIDATDAQISELLFAPRKQR